MNIETEKSVVPNAKLSNIFVYPKFHDNDGDMALLRLSEDLPLDDSSKHLSSICLPKPMSNIDSLAGQKATTTGWGVTGKGKICVVFQKERYNQ